MRYLGKGGVQRHGESGAAEEEQEEMHRLIEVRNLEGGGLFIAGDGGEEEDPDPPEAEEDPGEQPKAGQGEHEWREGNWSWRYPSSL